MTDLKKAQHLILKSTPVLGKESVPVLDALKRVLAQDITAMEALPAADISALDGYAVRYADLIPGALPGTHPMGIAGESRAGSPYDRTVNENQAIRITTGALIPDGADTIIKQEDAIEEAGTLICIRRPGYGEGIRFRGESMHKGDVVLHAGTVLNPLEIGVLASLRRAYVSVHRKPVVAIVSTGDELSDFHEPHTSFKAMSSNLYALAAQVKETGGTPLCMGIVKDDIEALQAVLEDACHADVIITSGGSSKGKYDLIHQTFQAMDVHLRFSNRSRKPGKPTLFGTRGKTLFFSLPGNPYASMLSFDQLVKPGLYKMMGHPDVFKVYCRLNGHFSGIDTFSRQNGPPGDRQGRAPHVLLGKPSRQPVSGSFSR
jgi:molybdopterin molybdotransferase